MTFIFLVNNKDSIVKNRRSHLADSAWVQCPVPKEYEVMKLGFQIFIQHCHYQMSQTASFNGAKCLRTNIENELIFRTSRFPCTTKQMYHCQRKDKKSLSSRDLKRIKTTLNISQLILDKLSYEKYKERLLCLQMEFIALWDKVAPRSLFTYQCGFTSFSNEKCEQDGVWVCTFHNFFPAVKNQLVQTRYSFNNLQKFYETVRYN